MTTRYYRVVSGGDPRETADVVVVSHWFRDLWKVADFQKGYPGTHIQPGAYDLESGVCTPLDPDDAQATCLCGQWEVEEYGERCPSCAGYAIEDARRAEL